MAHNLTWPETCSTLLPGMLPVLFENWDWGLYSILRRGIECDLDERGWDNCILFRMCLRSLLFAGSWSTGTWVVRRD